MDGTLKIDLHMHSTVSDGTDTPEELLRHVKEAGLSLFALTDHDAVKGYGMIRPHLTQDGPRLLSGVEFSCKDEEGKCHILGYDFDPDCESVLGLVEKGHMFRIKKVRGRLERLRTEFGFDFSVEDISALMALDNPGKPHIGNLMVKYGYAETKDLAITGYINKLHIKNEYIRPEEAIEGILRGGGIPVLAHAPYGSGDGMIVGDELDSRVRRLKGFGLMGLEGFYSTYTPRLRDEVLALAEKYGLLVTAGSDCHGRNKRIALGDTGLDQAEGIPDGLRRFLERVRFGV